MRIKLTILSFALLFAVNSYGQSVGIKTNLIYGATTTPNLALEFGLGKRTSLEVVGGYNPFEFEANKQLKHWAVQPGLRFWFCQKFARGFIGIHAHGGEFNVGKIDQPLDFYPNLKNGRYEGYFYGGGASIGYQWVLGKRWGLETELGLGYARVHYDKYGPEECAPKLGDGIYDYWGVTKASLSFVYYIW